VWSLALLAWVGVALAAPPARAESAFREAALGMGSALADLVYGPVKTVYALGGATVAGFAWLFSGGDIEVVRPIVDASVRGDYLITPSHLTGERPLEFIGRSPEQRRLEKEARSSRDPGGF